MSSLNNASSKLKGTPHRFDKHSVLCETIKMNASELTKIYIQKMENETEFFLKLIVEADHSRNAESMPLDVKFKNRLLAWTQNG